MIIGQNSVELSLPPNVVRWTVRPDTSLQSHHKHLPHAHFLTYYGEIAAFPCTYIYTHVGANTNSLAVEISRFWGPRGSIEFVRDDARHLLRDRRGRGGVVKQRRRHLHQNGGQRDIQVFRREVRVCDGGDRLPGEAHRGEAAEGLPGPGRHLRDGEAEKGQGHTHEDGRRLQRSGT